MNAPWFIADDLSGATEVGAGYHGAGRSVVLPFSLVAPERWPEEAVIGYSTESRNLPPEEAAARVEMAVWRMMAAGRRLDFKKIDSTLRGSPGAEIAATAACLPEARFLVTPANPAAGRTVRDGILRVNGVPVAETEFGRDPGSPVRTSRIETLLGLPSVLAPRLLPLDVVRGGEEVCRRWLEQAAGDGVRVVIGDAESVDDVGTLARTSRMGRSWLPVGSGVLALAAQTEAAAAPATAHPRAPVSDYILFVCGSAHPANRVQARMLADQRGVQIVPLSTSASLPRSVTAMVGVLAAARCGTLMVEPTSPDGRSDPRAVLDLLASVVAGVDARCKLGRLFVTGGETAMEVCRKLEGNALRIVGDVEAGVVVTTLETSKGMRLLATKPGGFGDEQSWVRVWDFINRLLR